MAKPAGLLSQQGRDREEEDLFTLWRSYLRQREGSRRVYLSLAHRLDRGTSGAILLTKTRDVNPGIAELFAGGLVKKRYLALCAPSPDPKESVFLLKRDFWVENRLEPAKSRGRRRQRVVEEGGDLARTRFALLQHRQDGFEVEAFPATGRLHQIRVHLADLGHPVLGDRLYGFPGRIRRWADRPMLHAASLSFVHPRTGDQISVDCPVPDDYRQCRSSLGPILAEAPRA